MGQNLSEFEYSLQKCVVDMIRMGTHALSGKKRIILQAHFCTERRG